MRRYRIRMLDALCGSGKTYLMIEYAIKQALVEEAKIIFVLPTMEVIDQVFDDATNALQRLQQSFCGGKSILPPKIHKLHGDSLAVPHKRVCDDLNSRLRNSEPDVGEVLICTHAAFLKLKYFHNPSAWDVIIDEIPDVVTTYDELIKVYDKDSDILDYLDITDTEETYVPLKIRRKRGIKARVKGFGRYHKLKPLADMLLDPYATTYIKRSAWNQFPSKMRSEDSFKLQAYSVLNANFFHRFNSVTVMGAHFKDSLFSKVMEHEGISFYDAGIDGDDLDTSNLRYQHHVQGELTSISYLTENAWSKWFRSKPVDPSVPNIKVMDDVISTAFDHTDNEAVLYTFNNDVGDFENHRSSMRLSGSPYGLNCYMDYTSIIFLSSLNPTPGFYHFLLEKYGIDSEFVANAIYFQKAYQAIMRTAIRNPEDTRIKKIVVPDRRLAEWLSTVFPGSTVTKIGDLDDRMVNSSVGRPKSDNPIDANERKRISRHRDKQLERLMVLKNEPLQTSEFASVTSKTPTVWLIDDFDQLSEVMKEGCKTLLTSKESHLLYSPSVFNGSRLKANVSYASFLVLDIDGGDLTPQTFTDIFSEHRMILTNTYSGGGNYRAIIATTQVMPSDVYRYLLEQLLHVVEIHGYVKKGHDDASLQTHGIDTTKFGAESIFYCPCQSKNGMDDSFFIDHPGQPIDPMKWINEPKFTKRISGRTNAAGLGRFHNLTRSVSTAISKCINEYRMVASCMGLRHREFFILGLQLKDLVKGDEERLRALLIEADYDGSRVAKGQIESVITTLRSDGYRHVG